MPSQGSALRWLAELEAGDQQAAQPLWERFFHRLVGHARTKLRSSPQRAQDPEDVALSAFKSFCVGVEKGRFPQLTDETDLWRLLVTITSRKAFRVLRYESAKRRGGADLDGEAVRQIDLDPEELVDGEPSPEFALEVAEECERLLSSLDNPELRQIALLKMEGFTNKEISEKVNRTERTIERKLNYVRAIWQTDLEK